MHQGHSETTDIEVMSLITRYKRPRKVPRVRPSFQIFTVRLSNVGLCLSYLLHNVNEVTKMYQYIESYVQVGHNVRSGGVEMEDFQDIFHKSVIFILFSCVGEFWLEMRDIGNIFDKFLPNYIVFNFTSYRLSQISKKLQFSFPSQDPKQK